MQCGLEFHEVKELTFRDAIGVVDLGGSIIVTTASTCYISPSDLGVWRILFECTGTDRILSAVSVNGGASIVTQDGVVVHFHELSGTVKREDTGMEVRWAGGSRGQVVMVFEGSPHELVVAEWDRGSERLVVTGSFAAANPVVVGALVTDGAAMATGEAFEIHTGAGVHRCVGIGKVSCILQLGSVIVTGTESGALWTHNNEGAQRLGCGHSRIVGFHQCTPDRVISIHAEGLLQMWDVLFSSIVFSVQGRSPVISFSSAERRFCTIGGDLVLFWETEPRCYEGEYMEFVGKLCDLLNGSESTGAREAGDRDFPAIFGRFPDSRYLIDGVTMLGEARLVLAEALATTGMESNNLLSDIRILADRAQSLSHLESRVEGGNSECTAKLEALTEEVALLKQDLLNEGNARVANVGHLARANEQIVKHRRTIESLQQALTTAELQVSNLNGELKIKNEFANEVLIKMEAQETRFTASERQLEVELDDLTQNEVKLMARLRHSQSAQLALRRGIRECLSVLGGDGGHFALCRRLEKLLSSPVPESLSNSDGSQSA